MSEREVYVIGAGIVGVSCALALQREGYRVTLLDAEGPCAGASFGNAGAVVSGSCVPTATPGIVGDALKMLLGGGPLSIRLRDALRLTPWLWQFIAQSREPHYIRNAHNLVALTGGAGDAWSALVRGTELEPLLRQVGWLRVFESDQGLAGNQAARELMASCGTAFELLNADELRQLEPGLAPIFKHAFLQRDCHFLSSPQRMVSGLVELLCQRGGRFEHFKVKGLHKASQGAVIKGSRDIVAPKLVIAAGAHSHTLTRDLGYRPPLAAERGYHLMLPPVTGLGRPTVHAEQGFVLCPMHSGLRLTSQVELARADAEPDYRYIRSLVPKALRMLPEAQPRELSSWMGARPSLPDSQPIISAASHPGVFYAFGHQHLGITLGPLTGQLIADLVVGREPSIDLFPYRASRF